MEIKRSAIVAAVRQGLPQRRVASKFKVALRTVQYWLQRAGRQTLGMVDWRNRSNAPHQAANQTPKPIVQRVLELRSELRRNSALGFSGAQAIADELRRQLPLSACPSVRTIGRILAREGLLDRRHRYRQLPPPPGWYLPRVAQGLAALDAFDVVEGLVIEGQGEIEVLTTTSLGGPLVNAWPTVSVSATFTLHRLVEHWRTHGLPAYAQFDNDTRFQGPHNRPNVLGRVVRLCCQLGVIPVFVPPRETGFQGPTESFNNLWQQKVWQRFHHQQVQHLELRSCRFVQAYVARRAARNDQAPQRRPFPKAWRLDLQAPLRGQIVFLRRTNAQGQVRLLQHTFTIDPHWPHRLLRCELDFDMHHVRLYRLRRRDPQDQPLLKSIPFHLPHRPFET